MAEMDYFAALGVSAPESGADTEVEQEVADPAENAEGTGAEEPEVADPATDPETDDASGEGDADQKSASKARDRASDAKYAAMRRRQEMDAAIQKAEKDTMERVNKLIESLGIKDPSDRDKTLSTVEDLEKYQKTKSLREMQARMKRGEMAPEDLEQMFAQTPLGKKMKDTVREAEAERERALRETANAKAQEQLREVQKLDPNVKSIQDIMQGENGQEFYDQIKKGNDIVTAYKIAHMDRLLASQSAQAAQRAALNAQSKAHLTGVKGHGHGAKTVPDSVAAQYRQFFPNASTAELQKMYNNYQKTKKG